MYTHRAFRRIINFVEVRRSILLLRIGNKEHMHYTEQVQGVGEGWGGGDEVGGSGGWGGTRDRDKLSPKRTISFTDVQQESEQDLNRRASSIVGAQQVFAEFTQNGSFHSINF